MSEVICEYIHICDNYGIKCDKCSFNRNIGIKNYLVIDREEKKIRFLEDSNEGI